jgi:hypothetical protein
MVKSCLFSLILLVLMSSASLAQNRNFTTTGPNGLETIGQYNSSTGRYTSINIYNGQTMQGQVRQSPDFGIRVEQQQMVPPQPAQPLGQLLWDQGDDN